MTTFLLIVKIVAIALGALAGLALIGIVVLALLLTSGGGNPFQ